MTFFIEFIVVSLLIVVVVVSAIISFFSIDVSMERNQYKAGTCHPCSTLGCGKAVTLNRDYHGRKIKCPDCKGIKSAPTDTIFSGTCRSCNTSYRGTLQECHMSLCMNCRKRK